MRMSFTLPIDSVMPSQRYALPRLEGTYRTYRPTYAK